MNKTLCAMILSTAMLFTSGIVAWPCNKVIDISDTHGPVITLTNILDNQYINIMAIYLILTDKNGTTYSSNLMSGDGDKFNDLLSPHSSMKIDLKEAKFRAFGECNSVGDFVPLKKMTEIISEEDIKQGNYNLGIRRISVLRHETSSVHRRIYIVDHKYGANAQEVTCAEFVDEMHPLPTDPTRPKRDVIVVIMPILPVLACKANSKA